MNWVLLGRLADLLVAGSMVWSIFRRRKPSFLWSIHEIIGMILFTQVIWVLIIWLFAGLSPNWVNVVLGIAGAILFMNVINRLQTRDFLRAFDIALGRLGHTLKVITAWVLFSCLIITVAATSVWPALLGGFDKLSDLPGDTATKAMFSAVMIAHNTFSYNIARIIGGYVSSLLVSSPLFRQPNEVITNDSIEDSVKTFLNAVVNLDVHKVLSLTVGAIHYDSLIMYLALGSPRADDPSLSVRQSLGIESSIITDLSINMLERSQMHAMVNAKYKLTRSLQYLGTSAEQKEVTLYLIRLPGGWKVYKMEGR